MEEDSTQPKGRYSSIYLAILTLVLPCVVFCKIHPIFVISVADCVLGLSWLLGGAMWFGRIQHRSWCYLPSLLTVVRITQPHTHAHTHTRTHAQIMVCVCVNLTVVYALVAYSDLKKREISDVLVSSQTQHTTNTHSTLSLSLSDWIQSACKCLGKMENGLSISPGMVSSAHYTTQTLTHTIYCTGWFLP